LELAKDTQQLSNAFKIIKTMDTNTIIILISIILYGIVFLIQKAQFKKQDAILNKYEKIFSIFNIDEIEKYVELQKKSMNLSFSNREAKLSNIEKKMTDNFVEVEKLLNSSKTDLENTKEISKALKSALNSNKDFVHQIFEISLMEFKEIHSIIEKSILKSKNPQLYKEIESKMLETAQKYSKMKESIIEKINSDDIE
jgi:hypothetical protein